MADDAAAPDGETSESTSPTKETHADTDTDADTAETDTAEAETDAAETDAGDRSGDEQPKPRMSHVRLATIVGLVLVLALGGLTGWLGWQAFESHRAEEQRATFLQVGRQGVLNLTTIDWQQAEGDVQRVLGSATGAFYDDFQGRSESFIEVVKQSQAKSVGTITEAGLESSSETEAQVLVAVKVDTSNAGAPEQQPRSWRMRITVQKVGNDDAKVSNVGFVA